MSDTVKFDPITGEVIEQAMSPQEIADGLVSLARRRQDALDEVEAYTRAMVEAARALIDADATGYWIAADSDETVVKVDHPKAGARYIDPMKCEPHREVLVDVGVAKERKVVEWPTAMADLKAAEKALHKAGIKPDDLISRRDPGSLKVRIEPGLTGRIVVINPGRGTIGSPGDRS